jgi:hypothetical protein
MHLPRFTRGQAQFHARLLLGRPSAGKNVAKKQTLAPVPQIPLRVDSACTGYGDFIVVIVPLPASEGQSRVGSSGSPR